MVLDSTDISYKHIQLAMYDTNYGFASSGNYYYITKNGWESFYRYPKLSVQVFYSPIFSDSNTVLMTLGDNINEFGMTLLRYKIDVNQFDTLYSFGFDPDSGILYRLYKMDFVNDSLGFACGDLWTGYANNYYDVIFRTKDGGHTWERILKIFEYPPYGLQDISFHDTQNGVAVGCKKIYTTNDGGETWILNEIPPEMNTPLTLLITWCGHYPIIGTFDHGGGLFRYEGDFFKFPPDTTGVEELLITNYQLLITPNPADDYIEIKIGEKLSESFKLSESYQVQIYNIYGECVIYLTPNPSPQAERGIRIDVSGMPSGMYFVRYGNSIDKFVKY